MPGTCSRSSRTRPVRTPRAARSSSCRAATSSSSLRPVIRTCPVTVTSCRSPPLSVRLNVVASAGSEVSRATSCGIEAPALPPGPPNWGQRPTQYVVWRRSSTRQVRAVSCVRRACACPRPACAIAIGLAQVEVAIAEVSSCSVSTLARNPAPARRLASWSAARTTHFCAPVTPPPRAATASGHSSGSSLSAIQVIRTAGEPVCAWSGP